MADFPHLGHVAVTVTDIDVSRDWYRTLLGAEPIVDENVGPYHHVVFAIPGGTMLGLHTFEDGERARFDERRVGLDHIAFHVGAREELDTWVERLDELGIEHGKIVDTPGGSGLAFRDPDNIQLEFYALPG